jgi:RNA polymerase sigma factor (sigma-70 family)
MLHADLIQDSSEGPSDTSLLEACGRGDREAFATLFDRHSRAVYATAFAVVRDRPDAEEVLSDAFMLLWRKRHSVDFFGDSLLPWLLVTARNLARNRLRAARGTIEFDDELRLGNSLTTEEQIARRELDRQLSGVIDALDPIDREIIQLCLVDGLSYQQAATRLGITHSSVRNRLSRSKNVLRTQLSAKETDQ